MVSGSQKLISAAALHMSVCTQSTWGPEEAEREGEGVRSGKAILIGAGREDSWMVP